MIVFTVATAVVEEVDFREHEDDFRQPGGHWGSSVCLDYIEVWTDKQKSKAKLCGTWDISNDRLTTHGSNQNLFGYCYDERGSTRAVRPLRSSSTWPLTLRSTGQGSTVSTL